MNVGIVGTKAGMTRVFDTEGNSIAVTVIRAQPNRVTQVKTATTDRYDAVQVTVGTQKDSRLNQALAGHYAKSGSAPGRGLWEFRLTADEADDVSPTLTVAQFFEGQIVDVCGTSKGKGFAGTVKRWNFNTQDQTHGNSKVHRAAGSIGQCQTPGKVFKGKKMAGQLGNARVTVQNLRVVRIDEERDLLLVKGAVPGATGSHVLVTPATKAPNQQAPAESS